MTTEEGVTESLVKKLKKIFKGRVGKGSSISQKALVKKLFPKAKNIYEKFYYADKLRRACHYLRRYSDYFIVSDNYNNDRVFFVLKTNAELTTYKAKLEKSRQAMASASVRAEEYVRNKGWQKAM